MASVVGIVGERGETFSHPLPSSLSAKGLPRAGGPAARGISLPSESLMANAVMEERWRDATVDPAGGGGLSPPTFVDICKPQAAAATAAKTAQHFTGIGGANKLQRGMESRGSPRGGHEPAREREERLLTFPSPFPWGARAARVPKWR